MEVPGMPTSRPRGRPRSFNRDAVLGRAMRVFWERGYEGTSIADLLRAMGITPPSLYAAFGSKEQLFREAIEYYSRVEGAGTAVAMRQDGSARDAIERMLRSNADAYADPDKPSGCMVVLCAAIGPPANESVRAYLSARRGLSQDEIQHRLEVAVSEGELPSDTETAGMALFYTTVLQGMSLQARDGAGRDALQRIVDGAMAAWDTFAAPARPRRRTPGSAPA
jgi:AcrR family transcriptional regulator